MNADRDGGSPAASASVIIAAHNEESTIGRLLQALTSDSQLMELVIVVVCNGCSDGTAEVARHFGDGVIVIELPEPGKRRAQQVGDAATDVFPRAYVDADVVISRLDLCALLAPLREGHALAAAPTRRIDLRGAAPAVRAYYRVWEHLPQVRLGLFGRGVIAVSADAAERVMNIPDVLSDDLAMAEAFEPGEVLVVPAASVVIRGPRTVGDLLQRRVRIVTGNAQADALGLRRPGAATSPRDLIAIMRSEPRAAADILVFMAVTLVARWRARRAILTGDFTTWRRDETSRSIDE